MTQFGGCWSGIYNTSKLNLNTENHRMFIELLVGYGMAFWQEAGTNGNWRQPPLPYEQHLTGHTASIGARYKEFELRYHDLGLASVSGTFVADADYNPDTRTVRPCATRIDASTTQHSTGITAAWAPTFGTKIHVTPELGLLWLQQKQWVTYQSGERIELNSRNRITPMGGLKMGSEHLTLTIEVFHRPRYVNSLAGGGQKPYKPGLMTVGVEARF
jgi:hypothetical protein